MPEGSMREREEVVFDALTCHAFDGRRECWDSKGDAEIVEVVRFTGDTNGSVSLERGLKHARP